MAAGKAGRQRIALTTNESSAIRYHIVGVLQIKVKPFFEKRKNILVAQKMV
jgi:hypothetical protein